MSAHAHANVIVVGLGAAGLVAALALARRGARVTLVGRTESPEGARTVALFAGTIRLLEDIGAWSALRSDAAPLRALRIVDDTDNLFRWRPVTFRAGEIGLDAFGYNIEARDLLRALVKVVGSAPGVTFVEGLAAEPRFEGEAASIAVESHGRLTASLIVAADGRGSPLRQAAGIDARVERLPQTALTAILDHDRPHDDVSTEFHTRGGPCTLVPLGDRRSSLVWMARHAEAQRLAALDDDAFGRAVEARTHSMLGAMRIVGRRAAIPLTNVRAARFSAPRLSLIGEAAHAFPPIGAQGLNLGLRDAAEIASLVGTALEDGEDAGGDAVLDAYDRRRRLDIASRTAIVSLMGGSLLSAFLPIDLARGAGMAALDLIGPLRRLVMQEGVTPGFRTSAHRKAGAARDA